MKRLFEACTRMLPKCFCLNCQPNAERISDGTWYFMTLYLNSVNFTMFENQGYKMPLLLSRDPKLSLCQRQKLHQVPRLGSLSRRQKPKPRALRNLMRVKVHQLPQLPVELPQGKETSGTWNRRGVWVGRTFAIQEGLLSTTQIVFLSIGCLSKFPTTKYNMKIVISKTLYMHPLLRSKEFWWNNSSRGPIPLIWLASTNKRWGQSCEKRFWCFLPFSWTAVSHSGLGKANVGTCLMKLAEVYPPWRGVYI